MASLHIKDFDLYFGINNKSKQTYPLLLRSEDSVAFIKVYLLKISQLKGIIKFVTGC